jgi:hypothetical protein
MFLAPSGDVLASCGTFAAERNVFLLLYSITKFPCLYCGLGPESYYITVPWGAGGWGVGGGGGGGGWGVST